MDEIYDELEGEGDVDEYALEESVLDEGLDVMDDVWYSSTEEEDAFREDDLASDDDPPLTQRKLNRPAARDSEPHTGRYQKRAK